MQFEQIKPKQFSLEGIQFEPWWFCIIILRQSHFFVNLLLFYNMQVFAF